MMKPIVMGGLMGAMMIWMLHGALTGGTLSTAALLAFVGMHMALIAVAVVLVVFGARMSPRLHAILSKLHRPSLGHVSAMIATAVVLMGVVHLGIHGLGGV